MVKESKYYLMLLVALFSLLAYFHAAAKDMAFSPFGDFGCYRLNASLISREFNPWSANKECEARKAALIKSSNYYIETATSMNSLGFLTFVRLFTIFDFRLAALLWGIVSLMALLYSLRLILKSGNIKPFSEDMFFVLFLVFAFWPMREAFHIGQASFLALFFMALSVFFMKDERWFLSGIALSLAIQTKEYLAISLLAFVWKRNWKVLAAAALGVVLVKMSEVLIYGWGTELAYCKFMLGASARVNPSVNNHALISAVYRIGGSLIGPGPCGVLGTGLIFILTGLAAFWKRKSANACLSFFPFLILSFIISPWIHESGSIILYPAIVAIWFHIRERKKRSYYMLFIAAYLLLGLGYSVISFPAFHSGLPALFTTGKLTGMILLFILAGSLAHDPNIRRADET